MAYNLQANIEQLSETLKKSFNFTNPHQIPMLKKVVVHRRLGEALTNSSVLESTFKLLYGITGQKPVFTKAKKSISNFKLREGQIIGCKVTLRRENMMAFLTNLIYMSLPKIRDFRGVKLSGFDKNGNFSFGITDDSIFPESSTSLDKIRGLDITICTSANTKEECKALLEGIGFPFVKRNKVG